MTGLVLLFYCTPKNKTPLLVSKLKLKCIKDNLLLSSLNIRPIFKHYHTQFITLHCILEDHNLHCCLKSYLLQADNLYINSYPCFNPTHVLVWNQAWLNDCRGNIDYTPMRLQPTTNVKCCIHFHSRLTGNQAMPCHPCVQEENKLPKKMWTDVGRPHLLDPAMLVEDVNFTGSMVSLCCKLLFLSPHKMPFQAFYLVSGETRLVC